MIKKAPGLFGLIEGLSPVNPDALMAYERAMAEEAIPKIIRDVAKRQSLAAEARTRRL